MIKFDIIIGNPPYGKNSSLAVKFLNLSGELATEIHYVLPRTFRKVSMLNRVQPYLYLVQDQTVADHHFPPPILTCYQMWLPQPTARPKTVTQTDHDDFEFVTPDQADVCVGRVGAGPCGKVFLDKFDQRSTNSHYFLKTVNHTVTHRLITLAAQFRKMGTQTVGVPSLSKHELIQIYAQSLLDSPD
jgi:hypothetical protein